MCRSKSELPEQDVKNHRDDTDANAAVGVATSGLEQAEVHWKCFGVCHLIFSIAVEPNSIAANQYTEENEGLEADVVQIGGHIG